MRRICDSIFAFILAAASVSMADSTSLSACAAVQAKRNSLPANNANIDESFVRIEPILKAETAAGLNGCVRVRFEALFGPKSPSPATGIEIQEAYAGIPVSSMALQAGRWYERYSAAMFFGRYLFGVRPVANGTGCIAGYGSGDMDGSVGSVVDGFRLTVPLVQHVNTDLKLSILPSTFSFEDVYFCILASSQPFDFLAVHLGANLQIVEPGDSDPVHRAALSAYYRIINDLNIVAEYGITDLERVGDESWIAAGVDIPTAGVFDILRGELEFHPARLGPDTYGDLALVALVRKKISILQFDGTVGTDPRFFGSRKLRHVGLALRISAEF